MWALIDKPSSRAARDDAVGAGIREKVDTHNQSACY
jgi:hypothetical protein